MENENSVLDKMTNLSEKYGEDVIASPFIYVAIFAVIGGWFLYKWLSAHFSGQSRSSTRYASNGRKSNFNCPTCSTNLRPTYENQVSRRGLRPDIANVTCPHCGTQSRWDVIQDSSPVLESFKKRS